MANMTALKHRKSTLGAPPGPDEASSNITAPEVAPAAPSSSVAPAAAPAAPEHDQEEARPPRRDMRTARRTNRTLPFSTKVSPAFDDQVREIAFRDGLMLCELLEKALAAYERERASNNAAG